MAQYRDGECGGKIKTENLTMYPHRPRTGLKKFKHGSINGIFSSL